VEVLQAASGAHIDRRTFIAFAATAPAAIRHVASRPRPIVLGPRVKAIAFDGLALFDPRPVAAHVESHFPGRGGSVMEAWRNRQFEYQWLRALGGHYVDFLKTTEDSPRFVGAEMKLQMPEAVVDELVGMYAQLDMWPDVRGALDQLHEAGVRLALLSNMTHQMLSDGLARAGLSTMIEYVLSTDAIKTFKPDPKAYNMGIEAFGIGRQDVLFVPFAAWDLAGAAWFGYPTFWLNRAGAPIEMLDVTPTAMGSTLADLTAFALA